MIGRILVYLDGSAGSRRAASWAIQLARALNSRVYAVYVVEQGSSAEEEGWGHLYQVEDEAFEAEVKVSLLMHEGDPGEWVLELARSYEVDLLVVAYPSRLGVSRLIERSPTPVVVMR